MRGEESWVDSGKPKTRRFPKGQRQRKAVPVCMCEWSSWSHLKGTALAFYSLHPPTTHVPTQHYSLIPRVSPRSAPTQVGSSSFINREDPYSWDISISIRLHFTKR